METIEASKDKGPENVYRFLSRAGFLDTLADDQSFQEWMGHLSFEDFEANLTRLNGLMRQIRVKDRRMDGQNVQISNELMGTSYLPPKAEDKEELLRKSFEGAKNMPLKDAGLLLYLSLQAIHPFADGNGRTGRLLYLLMEEKSAAQPADKKEILDFLEHDGDSGPGREAFTNKVRPPEEIYRAIEYVLARDVLGEKITEKFNRIYSGLQLGTIEDFTNAKLPDDVKERLKYFMSEGGGGAFSFRNIVLTKYLQDRGLMQKYATEDVERKLLRFDGQKILEDMTEPDAQAIITEDLELKKRFVEKLIDVITNSEVYKFTDGRTVKDHFYRQDMPE